MKLVSFCIIILGFSFQTFAQLTIAGGTNFKAEGPVYIVSENLDFVNHGNMVSTGGIYKFSGTLDARLRGIGNLNFNKIELSKTDKSNLILQKPMVGVNEGIIFNSGLLDLNGNILSLAATAKLYKESEVSRVMGLSGFIQIKNTMNAPSNNNLGNLGVEISTQQDLGEVTIFRSHAPVTTGTQGLGINRVYEIHPTKNADLGATLRLYYFDAELNGKNENELVQWKSEDNINWQDMGYKSRDTDLAFVETVAVNSFSTWTLNTPLAPLPVRDLALSGIWKNGKSELTWTTQAEWNNSHFDIERQYQNEPGFYKVGILKTKHAGGNSNTLTSYNYTDPAASNRGSISYRLKQVDIDGQYNYSKTIIIKPSAVKQFIVSVYPTMQVGKQIYIQVGDLAISDIDISVFDISGKLVMKNQAGYHSQWIPLPHLSSGLYTLLIKNAEHKFSSFISIQ